MDFSQLKFDANGLIPAIAQDARTNQVLMLAYMNQQSIEQTLETGYATYFSRSRQALWKKGETSGHTQKLVAMRYDREPRGRQLHELPAGQRRGENLQEGWRGSQRDDYRRDESE